MSKKMKFKFDNLDEPYELKFNWKNLSPFIKELEPDESVPLEIPEKTSIKELELFQLWLGIVENMDRPSKIDISFKFYYQFFVENGWKQEDKINNLIELFCLQKIKKELQHKYLKYIYEKIKNDEPMLF